MNDPAIIEAAARALCRVTIHPETRWHMQTSGAEIVLAAVTPLIRAQMLEEAAQVAEGYEDIAAEIRSLIHSNQPPLSDSA